MQIHLLLPSPGWGVSRGYEQASLKKNTALPLVALVCMDLLTNYYMIMNQRVNIKKIKQKFIQLASHNYLSFNQSQ